MNKYFLNINFIIYNTEFNSNKIIIIFFPIDLILFFIEKKDDNLMITTIDESISVNDAIFKIHPIIKRNLCSIGKNI